MSDHVPWTIERISVALSSPALRQRFVGEINGAPAHELLGVFARWQGIAEQLVAAAERGRAILASPCLDGDDQDEWTDVTDKVLTDAERLRQPAP
ncbi:hypothetical protein ACIRPK_35805 [Kitasatospora sp. NPDC101801]|uniref:hypothetical protein n=1 Tax=Kitasatospora sp. NPDC101801 TaxID=3364103 RepID=UPI00381A1ED9